MAYRNGNYSAFYVDGTFNPSVDWFFSKPDFNQYQLLRTWKSNDWTFPFNDSHEKTYNVRDGSDWEGTLKPRLHERLRNSENIILFLSSHTKSSKALDEEMEYGIGNQGLPVIAVYTDYDPILSDGKFDSDVFALWDKLPSFKRHMSEVPIVHIPMKKDSLRSALECEGYMVQTKYEPKNYRL